MYQIDLKLTFIIDPNTNQQLLFFCKYKAQRFFNFSRSIHRLFKVEFHFCTCNLLGSPHRRATVCCFERDKKASDRKQQNEENGGH